ACRTRGTWRTAPAPAPAAATADGGDPHSSPNRGARAASIRDRGCRRRQLRTGGHMHQRRRGILFLLLASLLFVPAAARAQDYPARPIRLIITSPAGSLVDVLGRLLADDLGTRLGQSIVVDNRSGAMTQVGSEALSRSAADGYTLMIGTSELTMLPFLKKGYRYDPLKDLTPIALFASSWTVFAVNPNVPAKTLPELIAYAKAHPGEIRYGSGGIGGALHVAVEMLKLQTRADLLHVPY